MEKDNTCIEYGYDDDGAFLKLEVHIPYAELKTFKLPRSCTSCPCGYMSHKCGRNFRLADRDYQQRSSTCKLRQLSIEEIIKMINEVVGR